MAARRGGGPRATNATGAPRQGGAKQQGGGASAASASAASASAASAAAASGDEEARASEEEQGVSAAAVDEETMGAATSQATAASAKRTGESRVERLLCCNVIQDDHASEGDIFRHPVFAYDEAMAWPPVGWLGMCCWHCCEELVAPPAPAPVAYDRLENVYRVFGLFCTWPCAKAYLLETRGVAAGEAMLLLETLARDHFGYCGPPILRAPPRHRLRRFGGDLTVSDFTAAAAQECYTIRPPIVTRPEIYERHSTPKPPARSAAASSSSGSAAAGGGAREEGAGAGQPMTLSPFSAFVQVRQKQQQDSAPTISAIPSTNTSTLAAFMRRPPTATPAASSSSAA